MSWLKYLLIFFNHNCQGYFARTLNDPIIDYFKIKAGVQLKLDKLYGIHMRTFTYACGGARWLSGRVSDSGEREVGGSKPTAAVLCL